jgi:hypothetical protein
MPTPIEVARKEIGTREPQAFSRYAGGRQEAWCAHFASWAFDQAGVPFAEYIAPSPTRASPTASVSFVASVLDKLGRLMPPTSTPQPNDLIFYKQTEGGKFVTPGRFGLPVGLGHVGIVEGIEGDKVVSIEGNFSDRVARVRTPRNSPNIAFYGRPFTKAQVIAAGAGGAAALVAAGVGVFLLMRSRK